MMLSNKFYLQNLLVFSLILLCTKVVGQELSDSIPQKFIFTQKIKLPATEVKDQAHSGTCWSFATTSFLESEILRLTGDTTELSEMYFVRKSYEEKAKRYIRFHGTTNFGEGGQAHDVLNTVREFGIMNDSDFPGKINGQEKPDHAELESILSGVLNVLTKNPSGKLSPDWFKAYSAILDVYLGKLPDQASYKNKTVQPSQLRDSYKIQPEDYIELTSFNHHAYFSKFILEIPDNWSAGEYYNLPVDELVRVMDYALEHGYTVTWDGDVSDKGFSHKNGLAIVPDLKLEDASANEIALWKSKSLSERKKIFYSFEDIVPERNITQEMRQDAFDNYSSTDDHLMHILGTVYDQNGKRYFLTKNSWSAESNTFGGFLYMSESYFRLNTIAILLHKDGIPKDIRKKLIIN